MATKTKREMAYDMYIKKKGNIKLVKIAKDLGVSDGTIRSWKSKDKWDDKLKALNGQLTRNQIQALLPVKKSNKRSKTSDRFEKEFYATMGNHSVTTGMYQKIFFDVLDESEKEMLTFLEIDKRKLLLSEILTLTVREKRLLNHIYQLKDQQMVLDKEITTNNGNNITIIQEKIHISNTIEKLEQSLSKVQSQMASNISKIHEIEKEDHKMMIDKLRYGIEKEEYEDDGFLEAISGRVEEIWKDDEEE